MFDVVDLTEECRQAAGDDLSMLSDEDLLTTVVEWEALRSVVEVADARLLGELQARGVTDQRFGLKTAPWVAAEAKVDRAGVNRRKRLGMGLRHLPPVEDAVASGVISIDHAAELARAAANPRVGDQVEAGRPCGSSWPRPPRSSTGSTSWSTRWRCSTRTVAMTRTVTWPATGST